MARHELIRMHTSADPAKNKISSDVNFFVNNVTSVTAGLPTYKHEHNINMTSMSISRITETSHHIFHGIT